MTQPDQPVPHKLSTVVFAGFEEIVGHADLVELFSCERETISGVESPEWMASLGRLEARYGHCGAQGVAHRAGRASFHHWLRQFGEPLHMAQLDFRLMPASRRLRFGFDAIAQTLQSQWGMVIERLEDDRCWRWRLSNSSDGRPDGQFACCSYLAGLLQEYLCWISGGKFFPTNETHQSERGRLVCEVVVRKQPLD